jgi:hypothetical protein
LWIPGPHIGVAQALSIERAGTKVLDEHVSALDQSVKHFSSFGGLEIERNAFLISVHT